jgi:tRNA U34 5-carboxymethylaminomethyl modifying enzyme MnmG/GidA
MKRRLVFGIGLVAILILVFSLFYSKGSNDTANRLIGKRVEEKEPILNGTKIQKATAASGESKLQNVTAVNGEMETKEEEKLVEIRLESKAEFDRILREAEVNLAALLELAKKEVEVKKEGNMDLTIIPMKYETILKEKEKETDSQFKIFLDKLESDMLENNLPPSLEEEYKREYGQKKLDRLFRLKEEIKKLV